MYLVRFLSSAIYCSSSITGGTGAHEQVGTFRAKSKKSFAVRSDAAQIRFLIRSWTRREEGFIIGGITLLSHIYRENSMR